MDIVWRYTLASLECGDVVVIREYNTSETFSKR